jgi:hypothetical protein
MMGRKARKSEDVFSCSQLIHRAFYVLQDTLWPFEKGHQLGLAYGGEA